MSLFSMLSVKGFISLSKKYYTKIVLVNTFYIIGNIKTVLQIGPISSKLSKAQDPVVPRDAHTYENRRLITCNNKYNPTLFRSESKTYSALTVSTTV